MLDKKNILLNFYEPKTGYVRGSKSPDFLALKVKRLVKGENGHTGANQKYLKLTFGAAEMLKERYSEKAHKIIIDPKSNKQKFEFKIAFSFGGGDENIVVLNPTGNVPSFSVSCSSKGYDYGINNSILIDDIWHHFGIDKKEDFIFLQLEYFTNLNGMHLYKLKPLDKQKNPYFSDKTKHIRDNAH